MIKLLETYRQEFKTVKQSNHTQERKNLRYANIMTKLEQDFNIPMMSTNDNDPAVGLYKEISRARVF